MACKSQEGDDGQLTGAQTEDEDTYSVCRGARDLQWTSPDTLKHMKT